VCKAHNLTTFMCRLFWNLGASTSWNPRGLSRSVMGLLYLYLYEGYKLLTFTRLYLFETNLMYSVSIVHTVPHVCINLSSLNQHSMHHLSSHTPYHFEIVVHIKESLKDRLNHTHIPRILTLRRLMSYIYIYIWSTHSWFF